MLRCAYGKIRETLRVKGPSAFISSKSVNFVRAII
jgi:hypothetical protein